MSWDNREGKSQTGLVAFLILWGLLWTALCVIAVLHASEVGWTPVATAGVILCLLIELIIPLTLLRKLCRESVTCDADYVCQRLRWKGLSLGTIKLKMSDIDSLRFASTGVGVSAKMLTINAGTRSLMLAYATDEKSKAEIFELLAPILQDLQPDIKIVGRYRKRTALGRDPAGHG